MLEARINFQHLTSVGFWDVFVLLTCKRYPWCTQEAGDQWGELFICSKWNLKLFEKATVKHQDFPVTGTGTNILSGGEILLFAISNLCILSFFLFFNTSLENQQLQLGTLTGNDK